MSAVTEHRLLAAVWSDDPTVITLSGSSQRFTLEIDKVYQLVGTKTLRFRQGDGTVVATAASNYLAEGAVVIIASVTGFDHLAVIEMAGGGDAILMSPTQAGE